jgi:hypothetical protein
MSGPFGQFGYSRLEIHILSGHIECEHIPAVGIGWAGRVALPSATMIVDGESPAAAIPGVARQM